MSEIIDVRESIMQTAWADFIMWAFEQPGCRLSFEDATGHKWSAPKTALDALIDKTCGVRDVYFEDFIVWVTANLWGSMDGLNSVPNHLRERVLLAIADRDERAAQEATDGGTLSSSPPEGKEDGEHGVKEP